MGWDANENRERFSLIFSHCPISRHTLRHCLKTGRRSIAHPDSSEDDDRRPGQRQDRRPYRPDHCQDLPPEKPPGYSSSSPSPVRPLSLPPGIAISPPTCPRIALDELPPGRTPGHQPARTPAHRSTARRSHRWQSMGRGSLWPGLEPHPGAWACGSQYDLTPPRACTIV